MKKSDIIRNGLSIQNPVFILMLGLCPALAVTTSLENGIGMGLSALVVLFFSNILISLLRNIIPNKIRIPCYIVIIATFVTITSLLLQAFLPALYDKLGIYVPLIVVNCIILGRAERFAKNNNPFDSAIDGLSMGLGFTIALSIIGFIREVLGSSKLTILGNTIFTMPTENITLMILPPGALLTIGTIIAFRNYIRIRKVEKKDA